MLVNADFSQAVIVTPDPYRWVPSPQPGVERVMLDRVGDEIARATSIVRYAPDSQFPAHVHAGGEEILVLSGTFSDRSGDYPAGWYLRNPPGSSHQPSTREGAVIFVKLGQMCASERAVVRVDTSDPAAWSTHGRRHLCRLFQDASEEVVVERIAAGQRLFDAQVTGAEIFVLSGELRRHGEHHVAGTWFRLPAGRYPEFSGGTGGATLYVKTGAVSASA